MSYIITKKTVNNSSSPIPPSGEKGIELRSEKVRNIIGQVPPVLLRYGIMIIGGALLILAGVSAIIPYQSKVDVEITVTQDDDRTLHYSTRIPRSAMKNRAKFTGVTLSSSSELPLSARFEIGSISDIVEVSGKNAWQSAVLNPTNKISYNVILEKPITVSGKILLEKQSVMMWVAGKMARK